MSSSGPRAGGVMLYHVEQIGPAQACGGPSRQRGEGPDNGRPASVPPCALNATSPLVKETTACASHICSTLSNYAAFKLEDSSRVPVGAAILAVWLAGGRALRRQRVKSRRLRRGSWLLNETSRSKCSTAELADRSFCLRDWGMTPTFDAFALKLTATTTYTALHDAASANRVFPPRYLADCL